MSIPDECFHVPEEEPETLCLTAAEEEHVDSAYSPLMFPSSGLEVFM